MEYDDYTSPQPPPHNLDAERSVIGCLMLEPQRIAEIGHTLDSTSFYDSHNAAIYRVILDLHARAGAVDPTLILAELKTSGSLNGFDYQSHLLECAQSVAAVGHATYYADIVARLARQRRAMLAAMDALSKARNGKVDEALADMRASAEELSSDFTKPKFVGITLQELAEKKYEIEFLVDGVLVTLQNLFIAGPPKAHKTSAAFDLAISLVTGTPFLGRFNVNRVVPVIYFIGEGGLSFAQDICSRVCGYKRINMSDTTGMVVCDRLPRMDSADDLQSLDSFLEGHEGGVAFFDPVYLSMGGADAGNSLAMGDRLNAMNRVCADHEVTPILLHHLKRNRLEQYSPAELSDLVWAGFSEFAASWLLLSPRSKYVPTPEARHELHMNVGGRAGHGGLYALDLSEGVTGSDVGRYWFPQVFDAEDIETRKEDDTATLRRNKRQRQIDEDRKEIVGVAVKLTGPETKNAIRDRVIIGHRRFDVAFASLVDDGTFQQAKVERANGQKYDGWKLTEMETI